MKKYVALILSVLLCCSSAVALANDGWNCAKCGVYNQSDALFCHKCAAPRPDSVSSVSTEYNAWVCPTCGRIRSVDQNYCTADATAQTESTQGALLLTTNSRANEYYVPEAIVDVFPVRIDSKDGVAIPIQPNVSGNYVIWLTDSVDGYSAIAYYVDKNGNEVGEWPTKRSESMSSTNGRTFSKELEGGQRYTLMLHHDYGFDKFKAGSFTLNIARPNEIQYISGYDLIHDSFVCQRQQNRYCFTPEVSGLYGLTCTEAYNGVKLQIEVYDQLNNKVRSTDSYTSSIGMNESLQYELKAGHSYMIYANAVSKTAGAYTLIVGYQNETADISGCEVVGDELYFPYQENIYTYTASATGEYAFDTSVMDRHSSCSIRVYDEYGSTVFGNNSWDSSCKLQGGRSYRIVVTNYSRSDANYACEYVLKISQVR